MSGRRDIIKVALNEGRDLHLFQWIHVKKFLGSNHGVVRTKKAHAKEEVLSCLFSLADQLDCFFGNMVICLIGAIEHIRFHSRPVSLLGTDSLPALHFACGDSTVHLAVKAGGVSFWRLGVVKLCPALRHI